MRSPGLHEALKLVVFIYLAAAVACAQTAQKPEGETGSRCSEAKLCREIDQYLNETAKRPNIAGIAVSVVKDGRIAYSEGYGFANVEKQYPVNPDTRFQIASVTKPFTSMATMMLAEEGKIRLGDPARKYLEWLPEKYSGVTVRQLLTHTSGVNRDLRDDNLDVFDEREFRKRLEARPVSASPGARFEYSNTGYILLGMIVEAVSGTGLGDFFRERIFAPLEMRNTRYYEAPSEERQRAIGYDFSGAEFKRAGYFPGGFGAGGLVSSANDLARFAAAISDGKLLKASSYQEIMSPAKLGDGKQVILEMGGMFEGEKTGYGFGWWLTGYKGGELLTHGGGVSGFSAIINRFPEEGVSIIVLANTKDAGVDRIASGVADIVLGKSGEN